MAITDYASLKLAVVDWADTVDSISDSQISDCVQFATHMFNFGTMDMQPLRVREMEEIASLTPTSGVYPLPADYLQYRRVVEDASSRNELSYVTPGAVDELYADRSAGLSRVFTIIGTDLYAYPVSTNDIELMYYQKIPELSDANTTNWLLTAHPMLYLHAVLFQMAMLTPDAALMQRSATMLVSLATGLMKTDTLANYAYAPVRIRGMTVA